MPGQRYCDILKALRNRRNADPAPVFIRPASYEADNSTTGSRYVQKASYTYHKDGMLKEIDNVRDGNFDQTNDYDFAGRLKKNIAPAFWQTLAYDAFSNLTSRDSNTWNLGQIGFSASFENNRNGDDTYDEAGNVIASQTTGGGESLGGAWYDDYKGWKFDASGRMNRWEELGPWGGSQGTARGGESTFDGDGRPAKYAELEKLYTHSWTSINFYYLYSSVTGQKITDINFVGEYAGNRVYMGDTVIHDDTVYQGPYWDVAYRATGFRATDPVSGSTQEINADGTVPTNATARNELAGNGTSIPSVAPTPYPHPNYYRRGFFAGDAGDSPCVLNGVAQENIGRCAEALENGWGQLTGPLPPGSGTWIEWGGSGGEFKVNTFTQFVLFGDPSDNLKNFRTAVEATRGILSKNNPCADFFKGAGLKGLDSISEAVEAQGNNAFSDLGPGKGGIGIQMIAPLRLNAGDFSAPGIDSAGNQYYGSAPPLADKLGNKITINTTGAFVARFPRSELTADRLGKFGNYPPTSLQSRVVQLLHEIGHLTITGSDVVKTVITVGKGKQKEQRTFQQFVLKHLLKPDHNDPGLSARNTDKILDACGGEIKALAR